MIDDVRAHEGNKTSRGRRYSPEAQQQLRLETTEQDVPVFVRGYLFCADYQAGEVIRYFGGC